MTNTDKPVTLVIVDHGRCEWGEDVTKEQDKALHDRYTAICRSKLAQLSPDAEIDFKVRREYTTRMRIEIYAGDELVGESTSRGMGSVTWELTQAAWESTIKSAADILGAR